MTEKQVPLWKNFSKQYLIAYNTLQVYGWSCVLYQVLSYYFNSSVDNQESLHDTVQFNLYLFQNLAVLEVLHAVLRLVKSSPIITLQQIASRVIIVCGVLWTTEAAKNSLGLPMLLFAWSITEIIRYSNYALNLVNAVPYFLVWLRYSTFIILYPIGVTGELLCAYAARLEFVKTGMWSISMPNTFNLIFYYDFFLLIFMMLYIPLFPHLFLHMVSQRRKVLGTNKVKSS